MSTQVTTSTAENAVTARRGRHAAPRGRSFARGLLSAVPVMLVGTLAVTLGTTPSEALNRKPERERPTPSPEPDTSTGLDFTAAAVTPSTSAPLHETASIGEIATAQSLAPFEYTVVEGDTVSDISGRYGLSTASVLALNGLSWKSMIFPGQILSLNASASPALPVEVPLTRYTIVAGDTISAIASSNQLDTEAVLSANGLGRDSIIYPGQTLVIPQLGRGSSAPVLEATPVAQVTAIGSAVGLTEEMYGNAASIVRIGRELGVSDRGIVIALAAAMQESTLRNIDWGHLDSVGLFQQRPSMGWGTAAQLNDPEYAIRAFYTGIPGRDVSTLGLLDIEGWESMTVTQAAQAVQISAYPDAYAKWESDAWAWLGILG
ncbi:MAG: LysM peptidoglycan-binding domain-containing protein [Naasia sp.]